MKETLLLRPSLALLTLGLVAGLMGSPNAAQTPAQSPAAKERTRHGLPDADVASISCHRLPAGLDPLLVNAAAELRRLKN